MIKHRNPNSTSSYAKMHGRMCILVMALLVTASFPAISGERPIIQFKDFTQTEVKAQGFTLPTDGKIHIRALGAGGERGIANSRADMFACGWIINADSRELVWKMDRNNTKKEGKDRRFDGELSLSKGNYEIYFSAYGYSSSSSFSMFNINIDRRKQNFDN